MFEILSHCVLDISIGTQDYNSNFVQNNEDMVVNILMHKIGYVMGLGYTSEENNLIYYTELHEINYNSKKYFIPERFEELYVG